MLAVDCLIHVVGYLMLGLVCLMHAVGCLVPTVIGDIQFFKLFMEGY
jgi:hypothetical protein